MAKPITESDIADLVAHVEESADALMAGDVDRYLAFIHHAEDYTLLNPAGGPRSTRIRRLPGEPEGHGSDVSIRQRKAGADRDVRLG
jgi:hypothetical protein